MNPLQALTLIACIFAATMSGLLIVGLCIAAADLRDVPDGNEENL